MEHVRRYLIVMKLDICFVHIQYSENVKQLENHFFKQLVEKIFFTNEYNVTCFDSLESSDKSTFFLLQTLFSIPVSFHRNYLCKNLNSIMLEQSC